MRHSAKRRRLRSTAPRPSPIPVRCANPHMTDDHAVRSSNNGEIKWRGEFIFISRGLRR